MLGKIPEQVWAVMLALLGVALEVTLLFAPVASEATRHDVHGAAFGLIMGAVGAFKGHTGSTNTTLPNATINQPTVSLPEGSTKE